MKGKKKSWEPDRILAQAKNKGIVLKILKGEGEDVTVFLVLMCVNS